MLPAALALAVLGSAFGQASRPPAPGDPIEPTRPIERPSTGGEWPREVLPGVRAHPAEGWVEFDGFVPIVTDREDPNDAEPEVLLELIVTSRGGGRDHESLVLTDARPSHVHAALLLLGIEAGEPGRWRERETESGAVEADPEPPTGPRLGVELRWVDPETGEGRRERPGAWVRHHETGEPLPERAFVFAGSQFVRRQGQERYDADFTGTLVGLAQFGSEVVAWSEPYHHDQALQEPIWFANNRAVPPFGKAVTVRLSHAETGSPGDGAQEEAGRTGGESPSETGG